MEEDFYMNHVFDSLNLTGQSQPSMLPDINDPSLDSQILNCIDFSTDVFHDINTSFADDIGNALIDSPSSLFNSCPQHSFEPDDIAALISSDTDETPRQSIIEDSMERMNINQTQTDAMTVLSHPAQFDGSSVEPKEIDNSILARQYVRNQQRLLKTASKSRKNSGIRHASSTVAPIDVVTSYGGCQPCTTIHINPEFDFQQQLLQFDSLDSKQIKVRCQPRQKFRPRMQIEATFAAHYLRCQQPSEFEYPTIDIFSRWAAESVNNIIEVTLVAKDKQPHCYALNNKQSQSFFDENTLIFHRNEPHTIYFRVTPQDVEKGSKSFMIEYIKGKQNETITKELIRQRELEQSMLRFTRFYEVDKDNYQRDDSSVAYSCVMTESYGDVAVEHMGPQYGPMGGNERVYAVLKGHVLKENIKIFVGDESIGWQQEVTFTKNGNVVYFSMPPCPFSQFDRAVTNITIYYKGEELHRSNFLYKGSLDQELAALNLSDSNTATNNSSTSNTYDVLDMISATGVRPVIVSSRRTSTNKRPKRLAHAQMTM